MIEGKYLILNEYVEIIPTGDSGPPDERLVQRKVILYSRSTPSFYPDALYETPEPVTRLVQLNESTKGDILARTYRIEQPFSEPHYQYKEGVWYRYP